MEPTITGNMMTGSEYEDSKVIQVNGLQKQYGRMRAVQAVKGVSFAVEKGQVFGLIGPDGAGKTSILQILAGVLRANGGKATLAGIDVIDKPEQVKNIIGYMPQGLGLNLYDSLTVEENITFFRELRQLPESRFRKNRDRLLAMTRLAPFLKRPAGKLSGGMRQKLALICTLIHLPDILLLDEPTTGVDPISRRDFWTIIHELVSSRNITVLLTTAYMDEAERCYRVALMHEGKVMAHGTPKELTDDIGGRTVALSGSLPDNIMQLLASWPGVESTALLGSEIHILLATSGENLDVFLSAHGVQGVKIRSTIPGLDDVFIHRVMEKGDTLRETIRIESSSIAASQETGSRLEIHNLSCRFDDFVAVNSVSLDIYAGEIFGLLGPNGAGKTTLIKMLCGLLPPSEGKAEVAGFDVTKNTLRLREHIGYMSQKFSLYRDLSVMANLNLYAGLYGLPRQQRETNKASLLNSLNLERYSTRLTGSLPLGIRQRAALACALLHEPPVLFLDEPTSGVDPIARRQFWETVHLLAQQKGVTVLMSTHYMDEAEHCDRLGLMHHGSLIAVDSPANLRSRALQKSGSMLAVETDDFSTAFAVLHKLFPTAMLYGTRIQWQSPHPVLDLEQAQKILSDKEIEAEVSQQDLTMEEAFVSFIQSEGETL